MSDWICDARCGTVAVYRGPRVDCFAYLSEREVARRWDGHWQGNIWVLPRRYIWAAMMLAIWLNLRDYIFARAEGDEEIGL